MSSANRSGSTVIHTPASVIFDILADPRQHQRIDGSGMVRGAAVEGPERLELGAKFGMDMKAGASYKTSNTVVEYEEDALIAWKHFAPHRWRYELAPVPIAEGGGTRVTETWDLSHAPAPFRLVMKVIGYPGRTQKAIDGTLVQLKAAAESDAGSGTPSGDATDS